MQLVPREVLLDIERRKTDVKLSESDKSTSAFQTFCRKATAEYAAAVSKSQQHSTSKSKDYIMNVFSREMKSFMKANMKDIRYVGKGSSRVVYDMADGTALKVALNQAGIAQNKQEAKLCMDPKLRYEIFPEFYGADTSNWLALSCELCAKAKREDFKELFMAQPIVVLKLIAFIVKAYDGKALSNSMLKAAQAFFRKRHPDEVIDNLLSMLIEDKTQAIHALRSLISFYKKNGLDEMVLNDLMPIDNWGITFREGQKVLVIIDAGFSEDVYQKHYKED